MPHTIPKSILDLHTKTELELDLKKNFPVPMLIGMFNIGWFSFFFLKNHQFEILE
jgi:hypothetical protein